MPSSLTHIGDHPPPEFYRPGVDIDVQCARCGSSCGWIDCYDCEDGYSDHDCGEDCCCCLHPEPNVVCDICAGRGGWNACISSAAWCEGNPVEGRESVKRGELEWYTMPEVTNGE